MDKCTNIPMNKLTNGLMNRKTYIQRDEYTLMDKQIVHNCTGLPTLFYRHDSNFGLMLVKDYEVFIHGVQYCLFCGVNIWLTYEVSGGIVTASEYGDERKWDLST